MDRNVLTALYIFQHLIYIKVFHVKNLVLVNVNTDTTCDRISHKKKEIQNLNKAVHFRMNNPTQSKCLCRWQTVQHRVDLRQKGKRQSLQNDPIKMSFHWSWLCATQRHMDNETKYQILFFQFYFIMQNLFFVNNQTCSATNKKWIDNKL